MNKLGIGLLIVNILAAAGLTYFALQDWSKRQEITAAVVRHQLALKGLPLDGGKIDGDNVEIRIEGTGGTATDKLPKKVLTAYLDAQGGANYGSSELVTSQIGEVNRAYQKLTSDIAGRNTPKEKLDVLVGSFSQVGGQRRFTPGILVYLADTYEERVEARALALVPNTDNAKKAQDKLAAKHAGVTAAITANGAGDAPRSENERRLKIARFLIAFEPTSDDWQKRTAQIIGLRTYLKAIGEQEARFGEILSRNQRRIEHDQATFTTQYQQLKELSIQTSQILSRQEDETQTLGEQYTKDGELTNLRTTQLAKRQKQVEDLDRNVAEWSDKNAVLEKNIHETRRNVGMLLDQILKLEADLEAAETKLIGK